MDCIVGGGGWGAITSCLMALDSSCVGNYCHCVWDGLYFLIGRHMCYHFHEVNI